MPSPDYADEYAACRNRVSELLADCDGAMASTIVPSCPAWTVRDLCSHLAGIATALVGRDNPGPDSQVWVDRLVAERADRPVENILAEWNDVGPDFEALMRAKPRAFGGLVYDVVAHEHDLRGAIDRPGARDDDGIIASLEVMVGIVERDLADKGPVPGTIGLSTPTRQWTIGSGEPTVSIETTVWELMRLLGSRRSLAQFRAAPWTGDVDPFLAALTHLPLPEHDIVE